MKINDTYKVIIEKLVNEGKGLCRVNNFPIFVEDSVPGDILNIRIVTINKSYAVGEIIDIITPTDARVKPLCPLHKVCGSCNWQHISYEEQLKQKTFIVKETLSNIVGKSFDVKEIIPSPKNLRYRCKVQYPISSKKSGRIVGGYYKKSTHELVNIKYCPMHSEKISKILEFIKQKGEELNISGYDEKKHAGILRHVIFRESSFDNKILIIFVINSKNIPKVLVELSKQITSFFSDIVGICVSFNTSKTNVILGKEIQTVVGQNFYFEKIGNITYKISADSFFQVNPYSAENIFNLVKDLIVKNSNSPTILDAYSGVSSFGIWLSDIASKVISVEEVKSASCDAVENSKINNKKNIKIINGDAAKVFSQFIKDNIKFDFVLIDPPRKGSSKEALEYVISLAKEYVIYVSCNPSTLARDLKFLIDKNFIPQYIQPVDMFPNTSHIETVVLIKNCNKKEA